MGGAPGQSGARFRIVPCSLDYEQPGRRSDGDLQDQTPVEFVRKFLELVWDGQATDEIETTLALANTGGDHLMNGYALFA